MKQHRILALLLIGFAGVLAGSGAFADVSTDTVLVSPADPTTDDSLHFDLHGSDHSCCVQLYNKKVTVNDSGISLFASFDDGKAASCRCLMAGFTTRFSCQPVKAGKYGIYYSEDLYCPPGQMCAAIALVVRSRQVGEVTVRPVPKSTEATVALKKHRQKTPAPVLSYSSSERKLIIRIAKPQYVIVTAYIVNGEKTTQLSSKRFLPAGTHSFRMDKDRFNTGVAIIHVKGEDFSEVKMINFAD
jgi:hypothetical protein